MVSFKCWPAVAQIWLMEDHFWDRKITEEEVISGFYLVPACFYKGKDNEWGYGDILCLYQVLTLGVLGTSYKFSNVYGNVNTTSFKSSFLSKTSILWRNYTILSIC